MRHPYRHRVNVRRFLNLPGFHDGAYVFAYVEDTSGVSIEERNQWHRNFEPRIVLEIADCNDRIALDFDISDALDRKNSLHKIDTLIDALQQFRDGLAAESDLHRGRGKTLRRAAAEQAAKDKQQARRG